jgi:hypothetical protein
MEIAIGVMVVGLVAAAQLLEERRWRRERAAWEASFSEWQRTIRGLGGSR